ncbi:hypothetical protein THAOC_01346, partial [Thalassiosira oceanica]
IELRSSALGILFPAMEKKIKGIFMRARFPGPDVAECYEIIAASIRRNHTLETLTWIGNQIPSDDLADLLIKSIIDNRFIENVSMQKMFQNGLLGIDDVASALATNPQLETLFMTENQLNDGDAVLISHALKQNTNLQTMYLYDNNITSTGFEKIGTTIYNPSSLNAVESCNHTCWVDCVERNDQGGNYFSMAPQQRQRRKLYKLFSARHAECSNARHLNAELGEGAFTTKLVPRVLECIKQCSIDRSTDAPAPLSLYFDLAVELTSLFLVPKRRVGFLIGADDAVSFDFAHKSTERTGRPAGAGPIQGRHVVGPADIPRSSRYRSQDRYAGAGSPSGCEREVPPRGVPVRAVRIAELETPSRREPRGLLPPAPLPPTPAPEARTKPAPSREASACVPGFAFAATGASSHVVRALRQRHPAGDPFASGHGAAVDLHGDRKRTLPEALFDGLRHEAPPSTGKCRTRLRRAGDACAADPHPRPAPKAASRPEDSVVRESVRLPSGRDDRGPAPAQIPPPPRRRSSGRRLEQRSGQTDRLEEAEGRDPKPAESPVRDSRRLATRDSRHAHKPCML